MPIGGIGVRAQTRTASSMALAFACAITAAAVMLSCLLFAAAAHASQFDFCGTSSSPTHITGGHSPTADRCAGGGHTYFWTQTRETSSATNQCAIVKSQSDGGGSNTTPPTCGYTTFSESDCTAGWSCVGYATIVNSDCCLDAFFFGYAAI